VSPGAVLVWSQGTIRPASEAGVPILDHGFLYGDSVYEVVRTGSGRPFLLLEHLRRLRRSGALLYFDLPWSDAEIETVVEALQKRLAEPDCYFRIIATRGPGPISLLPDGCERPGLYVLGCGLMRYPERMYREGCRLAIVPRLRTDPRSLDPRAKTGNYLNNMLGLIEARRAGADDALFFNAEGKLTESTTANAWIVEGGRIITPPLEEGLLEGITRNWIFQRFPATGIPVFEEAIDETRLREADEVFLSGTVKGIMPVAAIDGRAVGAGRPGPVTARAGALYEDALAAN